jgi:hypothetical protein
VQKTFDTDGAIQLDVRLASGEIDIDATLDGKTEVELIGRDDESRELIDAATVELRGSELIVDVPRRGGFSIGGLFGSRGITCRIRCPRGSLVRTRTKSAGVRINGVVGGLDASTASGDLEAGDVLGDLSCKAASGDIAVGDVGGRASASSASGDVALGHVRGNVSANSASGDLAIESTDANAKANTASGDVRIGAVIDGEVTVNSASGDVQIGVRRGSRVYLDCSTVSGDTSSELDMTGEEPIGDGPMVHIKARTVSGDIKITRATAPAESTQEVPA